MLMHLAVSFPKNLFKTIASYCLIAENTDSKGKTGETRKLQKNFKKKKTQKYHTILYNDDEGVGRSLTA